MTEKHCSEVSEVSQHGNITSDLLKFWEIFPERVKLRLPWLNLKLA